jgi:hypothetical protein
MTRTFVLVLAFAADITLTAHAFHVPFRNAPGWFRDERHTFAPQVRDVAAMTLRVHEVHRHDKSKGSATAGRGFISSAAREFPLERTEASEREDGAFAAAPGRGGRAC